MKRKRCSVERILAAIKQHELGSDIGGCPTVWLYRRSHLSREVHTRCCERPGLRFPGATALVVLGMARSAVMLAAVESLMERTSTASQCPQDPMPAGA